MRLPEIMEREHYKSFMLLYQKAGNTGYAPAALLFGCTADALTNN